jgi:hypothetical protein
MAVRFSGAVFFGGGGGTEGGYFDGLIPELEVGETKPAADETAVAKQLLDLFRRGICCNVKILRRSRKQQIADASSDQIGNVSMVAESVEGEQGVTTELLARNVVFAAGDDARIYGLNHLLSLLHYDLIETGSSIPQDRRDACLWDRRHGIGWDGSVVLHLLLELFLGAQGLVDAYKC